MANDSEEWRQIEGFNQYEVSSFGNVRFIGGIRRFGDGERYAPPCVRRLATKANGYKQVTIDWPDGRAKNFYVHRLVAAAFIENKDNKPTVNHKDGNKSNNHVCNLEWVTHKENIRHAIVTFGAYLGERHPQARLTEDVVREIRSSNEPRSVLAERYGISNGHVSGIRRRDAWKHI